MPPKTVHDISIWCFGAEGLILNLGYRTSGLGVARPGSIPALTGVRHNMSCARLSQEHGNGIAAHRGDGSKRHEASAQNSPLIGLLHEDGCDQLGDGWLLREDPDDLSSVLLLRSVR